MLTQIQITNYFHNSIITGFHVQYFQQKFVFSMTHSTTTIKMYLFSATYYQVDRIMIIIIHISSSQLRLAQHLLCENDNED